MSGPDQNRTLAVLLLRTIAGALIIYGAVQIVISVINLTRASLVSAHVTRPESGTQIAAEGAKGTLTCPNTMQQDLGTAADDGRMNAQHIGAVPLECTVTVALTTDLSGVDFLFVVPGLIGGRVIADLNGNGIAEPAESGISGVAVDLNRIDKLGQSTPVTTVSTSSDGTFFFPIEPAGTYTVVAHPAAGAMATGANAGSSGTAPSSPLDECLRARQLCLR